MNVWLLWTINSNMGMELTSILWFHIFPCKGCISHTGMHTRLFTRWIHNRIGKGVRKVIPSCAVWIIRDTFPEESGIYVPFQEAKDELSSFL